MPKLLLKAAGFTVRDPAEGHLCCGSAGTYNILQSEISDRLKARKVKNLEATKPDVIATGNIGCITQIATGTAVPIVHTVELLDWAYGGPKPAGLAGAGRAAEIGLQGRGRRARRLVSHRGQSLCLFMNVAANPTSVCHGGTPVATPAVITSVLSGHVARLGCGRHPTLPSCSGLTRASTRQSPCAAVDPRVKPEDDGGVWGRPGNQRANAP